MKKPFQKPVTPTNGKAPEAIVSPAPDSIALAPAELEQYRQHDLAIAKTKIDIANVALEIDRLEKLRADLFAKSREQHEVFVGMIRQFARAHGIDPDTTTPGSNGWTFQMEDAAFVKNA